MSVTTETYSRIRSLGLKTVSWKESDNISDAFLGEVEEFIKLNKPCLFIHDPKRRGSNDLRKDYLFDVKAFSEVLNWIESNKEYINSYSYLITTQITNHGDGFVGTLFSDGEGRIACETLHKPEVCNHRSLTMPKDDIVPYLDIFISEGDSLHDVESAGGFMDLNMINRIKNTFSPFKGYFEFVFGVQAGKKGIFTTGYINKKFPENFHEQFYTFPLANRIHAIMLSNT